MPAAFPRFHADLTKIQEFVNGLGAYFNDHFGFRKRLVRWERRWKWQFFHDARAAETIIGKDGWFYFSDGHMVDDVRGTRPFSEGEIEAWCKLLTGRRDWLAQRGIRYLFVIPPDKHTIYPEYLPDWLLHTARPARRLDQFLAYLRAHSDVPILDLREVLQEAKAKAPIYLQTDTHWNDLGAFAASQRLVREVSALGVPATAADLANFRAVREDEPGGDLARMIGQENYLTEKQHTVLVPLPGTLSPDLHDEPGLLPKNWIPGTGPQLSHFPSATGKVVMFRDSYAIALTKFFGYSFGRVAYLWQQNWDKPFIEREKPDIVIDEMLERFLIFRDPESLRRSDDNPNAQILADS